MSNQTLEMPKTSVYSVTSKREYQKAGPNDLIMLRPVPGGRPLFLPKKLIEAVVFGIVAHEFIHLSGPSGTCKSSLIEALYLVPENFKAICAALGFEVQPLRLFAIEMATYESPGELYQRRGLEDGNTFDELSRVVDAVQEAASVRDECYPLIWLREMGRVHSSSVQGGLLNLLTHDDIVLPDGTRISGQGIGWIADSNYQAEQDSTHTLVTLDDALRRRFSLNITLGYLPPEQEAQVLFRLVQDKLDEWTSGAGTNGFDVIKTIERLVMLGQLIRKRKAGGDLMSAPPPTIYGYMTFMRMAVTLPHHPLPDVACMSLLGNVSLEDDEHRAAILNEVFGLRAEFEDEPTLGGNII